MYKKRLAWWLIFSLAACPFLLGTGLYFFSPRNLGIDPVEVLLHQSGLWALRFLLMTLACSPLRRLGIKWLIRYRRMLGLYAFFYASLHLGLYVFGWIALDWHVLLDDLTKRPFIYIGMMAWLVLLVLAATSPKRMIRLLRHHWQMVHKSIYAAVVLAWIHLLMQSRASADQAVFYLVILSVLLGERLVRLLTRKLRVVD